MNILIVDDEVHVTDGISHSIDWISLGIEHVYTAYNMKQAQAVFQEYTVDILLCDIEMPKGSGLDLLGWVRDHGYEAICIFLTSHANFDYANQAIRLESLDYVLKPVPYEELTKIIKKAIKKVKDKQVQKQKVMMAQYWDNNHNRLAEQFWLQLVEGGIPSNKLSQEAAGLYPNQPIHDLLYCPIILQLIPTKEDANEWETSLVEYTLKNILTEELFTGMDISAISRMEKDLYLITIGKYPDKVDLENLAGQCEAVLSSCSSILPYSITCYMKGFVPIEEMPQVTAGLLSEKGHSIPYKNTVYLLGEEKHPVLNHEIPLLNQWIDGIFAGEPEPLSDIYSWLDNHANKKTADRILLRNLYHDFLQGISIYLYKRGIQAHELFQDVESEHISKQSTRSIEDMKIWIGHTTKKALLFFDDMEKSGSVINTIQEYIHEHLSEELSRNELAALVYITPDYLSHYFKDKTGISLTDYILAERMREAKRLLHTTRLPIGDIALKVGYPSISYFSKLFKRTTGKTPLEYRKQQG